MNQWGVIWSVRDSFIAGLFATLELFITAALAALIIGIALCYFSEYQKKVINRIIIGFVSLMRAIPFLILAYLLYYGLPQLGIREGANKQVISSQADSLIKISRIWADFFPANTSNQP
ncbi:ABC transporter permease subunit, partial [Klebsiella pneumoniae]